jgi:hypothetical protein
MRDEERVATIAGESCRAWNALTPKRKAVPQVPYILPWWMPTILSSASARRSVRATALAMAELLYTNRRKY